MDGQGEGSDPAGFDLEDFLPYLLNQAAETASQGFQRVYRDRHGMTRTQWRVMAHLGRWGAMTARDICARSHIDKTKVSRAVAALEAAGWLARAPGQPDRRTESLALTPAGRAVFAGLGQEARAYDAALRARLGPQAAVLDRLLRQVAAQALDRPPATPHNAPRTDRGAA